MVHMRDMGPRGLHPFGHGVGILACVLLDGTRSAAVRVSFAQHWVDRGANALGVALPDGFFLICFRIAGVIRNFVALGLQLFDRSGELRDGGADVGQLDDIGIGLQCFFAKLRQRIGHALRLREVLREAAEDAGGQGDVGGLDLDLGRLGERPNHRQKGVRGQHRRLIGEGVNNGGILAHSVFSSSGRMVIFL